ncbi:2-alkenal reductase (NADP(+)-dependent) [Spatholobus suberectus]|nr:2-alkenal reductase (NADP(+)-dependent) [Spatholobus suberectus]
MITKVYFLFFSNEAQTSLTNGSTVASCSNLTSGLEFESWVHRAPQVSNFDFKTDDAFVLSVEPGSDDIVVKNLYISVDPYQIHHMKSKSPSHSSISAAMRINPGEAIDSSAIGKVVASGNAKFQKDDLVMGFFTLAEYSLVKEDSITHKIESPEFPLSYHLGVLGFSGLSAYAGFFEGCRPRKGEKVFVSAGPGSVGNLVGQYAKILGCYVVGCAGSQKKVELLKEKLGFDDAFNYKEHGSKLRLRSYFPDGIDIYFDNVGGELLEAAVANMKAFGRVAVRGVISEYTDAGKRASPDMLHVVLKRITIRGFLVSDLMNVFAEFLAKTLGYLCTGKLKVIEDIYHRVWRASLLLSLNFSMEVTLERKL